MIKQYRHFLLTYFCIYPFKLPYRFYDFQRELVNWYPSRYHVCKDNINYPIHAGYYKIDTATWKINRKTGRQNLSILFNQICINEEMPPKYAYFKLRDPAAYQYIRTLEYRRDLVKRQITLYKDINYPILAAYYKIDTATWKKNTKIDKNIYIV